MQGASLISFIHEINRLHIFDQETNLLKTSEKLLLAHISVEKSKLGCYIPQLQMWVTQHYKCHLQKLWRSQEYTSSWHLQASLWLNFRLNQSFHQSFLWLKRMTSVGALNKIDNLSLAFGTLKLYTLVPRNSLSNSKNWAGITNISLPERLRLKYTRKNLDEHKSVSHNVADITKVRV